MLDYLKIFGWVILVFSILGTVFLSAEPVSPTNSSPITMTNSVPLDQPIDLQAEIEGRIKQLLNDNPLMVEEARNELLEIGKPAVPALIKALDSEKPQLRYLTCEILVELRDERSLPALIKSLKDKEEIGNSIASVAARGLGLLGTTAVITPLMNALPTADVELRYETIRALGILRVQEAIPVFIAALSDTAKTDFNYLVKCVAIEALGKLKAKSTVKHLINLLPETEIESATERPVVYYVVKALEEITSSSFGFVPSKDDKRKQEIIKQWQDWWTKNRGDYGEVVIPPPTPPAPQPPDEPKKPEEPKKPQ